jgi:hypothetical protein
VFIDTVMHATQTAIRNSQDEKREALKNAVRGLYDQIGKDLYNRGLIGTDGFHTVMSGSGVYAKRATELGEQFLKFITVPRMD